MFLPGQAPPPKPKKTAPRRKRKTNNYGGATGRFRLETYNPIPSSEPPIMQGAGPYASEFRAYPAQRSSQHGETPGIVQQQTRYPSMTTDSMMHSDGSASPAPSRASSSRPRNTASRSKASSQVGSSRRPDISTQVPTPVTTDYAASPPPPVPRSPHNYYRRDYETGQRLDSPVNMSSAPSVQVHHGTTHFDETEDNAITRVHPYSRQDVNIGAIAPLSSVFVC